MGTCRWFRRQITVKKVRATTPLSKPPKHSDVNPAEQGQTANITQNRTNKGFFKGRRIK